MKNYEVVWYIDGVDGWIRKETCKRRFAAAYNAFADVMNELCPKINKVTDELRAYGKRYEEYVRVAMDQVANKLNETGLFPEFDFYIEAEDLMLAAIIDKDPNTRITFRFKAV